MLAKNPINLNKALPSNLIDVGVPTDIVKTIILYREQIGGYGTIKDLKKIPGLISEIYEIIENNFFVPECAEYKLFGGDIINIVFAGKSEEHTVSPDGFVYLAEWGKFSVGGATVQEAQELISRKVEAVAVELKIVTNKVSVVGYSLSTTRGLYYPGPLSSVLSQIGGVNLRMKNAIRIIRHNEFKQPGGNYEIFYADQLNWSDPFIQNGDTIVLYQKNIYKISDTLTAYGSVLLWPLQIIGQGLAAVLSGVIKI
ncbi:MAG: polysaccharide biosynthesis/export family protein [Caldisericia bacterium]